MTTMLYVEGTREDVEACLEAGDEVIAETFGLLGPVALECGFWQDGDVVTFYATGPKGKTVMLDRAEVLWQDGIITFI